MTLLAINETFLWIGWFLFVILFGLVAINVIKLPKIFKKSEPTPVENFDTIEPESNPQDLPGDAVLEEEKPGKKMKAEKAKP
jgi:hypothetical protein